MKPREKVLAALDHRSPDRMPVDFGEHGGQRSPPEPIPDSEKPSGCKRNRLEFMTPLCS